MPNCSNDLNSYDVLYSHNLIAYSSELLLLKSIIDSIKSLATTLELTFDLQNINFMNLLKINLSLIRRQVFVFLELCCKTTLPSTQ